MNLLKDYQIKMIFYQLMLHLVWAMPTLVIMQVIVLIIYILMKK